jgi:hypothetical protein
MDVNDNAGCLNTLVVRTFFASRLACMFRLEGVGGPKSSIPTLASTDRGRLLVPPFLPKSADKEFIGKTDDRGKPAQR